MYYNGSAADILEEKYIFVFVILHKNKRDDCVLFV